MSLTSSAALASSGVLFLPLALRSPASFCFLIVIMLAITMSSNNLLAFSLSGSDDFAIANRSREAAANGVFLTAEIMWFMVVSRLYPVLSKNSSVSLVGWAT